MAGERQLPLIVLLVGQLLTPADYAMDQAKQSALTSICIASDEDSHQAGFGREN